MPAAHSEHLTGPDFFRVRPGGWIAAQEYARHLTGAWGRLSLQE
jgi:hypothetical protein